MQRHPRQVRSAILHVPAPTNAAMPLSFAVDADNALESLLADCRADAGCQSRFPDSRTNLFRVLDALEAKPVTAEVPHPATGKPVPVQLNRAAFAQLVRYMLYVPSWAARIPLVIDSAGRGDFEEAGAMALLIGSALGRASDALYAAVTCTEDVPFFERETGRLLAAGTFLGPLRVDLQKELCNGWPRGSLPTDYREPLRSDVPTLLLVGERDPSTPSRWARSIAAQLPNSRLVIVPDGGHDFDGLSGAGCLDDLQNRFVREASFASIDLSCLETTSHPPFALAKESKVAVELTGETLARLAGTYGGAGQGPQIRIAREDGQLFAIAGDQRFQLAASSSLEFTIPGAPGLKFVFEERQGKVIALRFIEGGGEGTRLARIEE
jgi:pimeloyl-ACP methyl ester carboxylesterase